MRVQRALHYLNDFLLLGPANSPEYQTALTATLDTCSRVGPPRARENRRPHDVPNLSRNQNQHRGQPASPPTGKKLRPSSKDTGRHHSPKRSSSKRDLSLIGLLNHAARVVCPGRAFLHGLIDASTTVQQLDHKVHLNTGARADLAWWDMVVSTFPVSTPSHYITSDA